MSATTDNTLQPQPPRPQELMEDRRRLGKPLDRGKRGGNLLAFPGINRVMGGSGYRNAETIFLTANTCTSRKGKIEPAAS